MSSESDGDRLSVAASISAPMPLCLWQFGPRGNTLPSRERPLIVKYGGSLLNRYCWPLLMQNLLDALGSRSLVIIVGGGAVVDGLRTIDQAAPQPIDTMHRLAIEAMGLTAAMVAQAVGLKLIDELATELAAQRTPQRAVLHVPAWLACERHCLPLPVGWHVTSDSIAAHVATVSGYDLLLAKSVPPPAHSLESWRWDKMADSDWVDPFFPTAAATLQTITWAAPLPLEQLLMSRTSIIPTPATAVVNGRL